MLAGKLVLIILLAGKEQMSLLGTCYFSHSKFRNLVANLPGDFELHIINDLQFSELRSLDAPMNFSFQFVCSTWIKMHQESDFCWGGGHFQVLCIVGSLELPGASPTGPPSGLCLGPTGGSQRPPDPQLLQAMTYIAYRAFYGIPLSSMPSRQIWPTTLNFLKKAFDIGKGNTSNLKKKWPEKERPTYRKGREKV